jgi:hypothetical protein
MALDIIKKNLCIFSVYLTGMLSVNVSFYCCKCNLFFTLISELWTDFTVA